MAKISVVNSSDDKRIAKFNDFLGVDFSSSIIDVNKKRASFMMNMINDNGINVKRPGFKTILEISEIHGKLVACFELAITLNKNESYFLFITELGKFLIYKVTNYDFENAILVTTKTIIPTNQDYYCFNQNNKAYILGGGHYHVIYLNEFEELVVNLVSEDSNTFIPTTTIGITVDGDRTSYSQINTLTKRRKNKLVGVIEEKAERDADGYLWWTLDAPIDKNKTLILNMDSLYVANKMQPFVIVDVLGNTYFPGTNGDYSNYGDIIITDTETEGTASSAEEINKVLSQNSSVQTYICQWDINDTDNCSYNEASGIGTIAGKYIVIVDDEPTETQETIVKIDFESGKIGIHFITTPPIAGQNNITIEFTPNIEFETDYIEGCTFGIQFGAEGYEDRLFLSGNPKYPNSFYYSNMDDFTYFPAMNSHTIGNIKSPIVAFSRLNDSTLAIHTKNNYVDPTIYYLSPKEVIKTVGETELTTFNFGLFPGVVGETPVNNYTNYSLSGDNIFLSKNGVFGIELSSNVSSTERYERARSKYVNKKLLEHEDLSQARAIVFQNRYYLAIDGSVYIADARFKSGYSKGDMTNTFNYEWWYWVDIDVKQWIVINDKLCFIDSKYMLYQFDKEKIDRVVYKTALYNSGNFTLEQENTYTKIDFNIELIEAETGDKVVFSKGQRQLFKMNSGNIIITSEFIKLTPTSAKYFDEFKNGMQVKIGESIYFLSIMDYANKTFRLYDGNGDITSITYSENYLTEVLDGEECYLYKENDSFYLKRFEDSPNRIILVDDTTNDSDIIFYLVHSKNIPTKFFTGAIDFGTTVYSKNLHNVSIVLEPSIEGTINFGYTTNKFSREKESSYFRNNFDFNDMDFTNFSFETNGVACSRNFKCKVRNFNFIMFRFENDGEGDFSINSLSVIYSVGRKNKGVK